MLTAANLALLLGVCLLLTCLPLALAPEASGRFLITLPRNRWVGYLLSAIALVWAGWLLTGMPMGIVDRIKPYLPILTLVTIGLVWAFMADLLTCRALGALLALIPSPILRSSWHLDTNWRYVLVILAYAMAITGMMLILGPFRMRQALAWGAQHPARLRLAGVLGSGVAGLLLLLGLTVY